MFLQILLQVAYLIGGFVLLIKGAGFFVKGASAIAHKFGVPQIIIGLTVVAMGTSAPEAAVSISAALGGNADITVGNVVGSNIMNVFIILGITALVAPLAVEKSTIKIDMPFSFVITVILLCMGLLGSSIDRVDGAILFGIFILYMVYLFRETLKNKIPEEESRPTYGQGNVWTFLMTLVGLIMIVLGSRLTVMGASNIALAMGVSQRMIALTVVAFGTSLPELVTSVTAARRGSTGIAIGNIVGSNVFNVLFVIGLTAIITPVKFIPPFAIDTAVAAVSMIMLWIFAVKYKQLNRPMGAVFVLCYAAYFSYILFL